MPHKKRLSIGTFVLVLGIVAFVLVRTGIGKATKPTYDDAEGYAVLSLLLPQHGSVSNGRVIAIAPMTSSEGQMLSHLSCGKVPDGFQFALKDFHEKNKMPLQLTERFSLAIKYRLSNDSENSLQPPKPGEQELDLSMRTPVFVVSAVGFDVSRRHAVAYVSFFCGGECGGGGYHFLTKEEKGWKEVAGSPACEWMSRAQSSLPKPVPA